MMTAFEDNRGIILRGAPDHEILKDGILVTLRRPQPVGDRTVRVRIGPQDSFVRLGRFRGVDEAWVDYWLLHEPEEPVVLEGRPAVLIGFPID